MFYSMCSDDVSSHSEAQPATRPRGEECAGPIVGQGKLRVSVPIWTSPGTPSFLPACTCLHGSARFAAIPLLFLHPLSRPPPLAFPLPVALAHFPLTCNLSFLQVDADRVRVVASVARNNAIAADLAESERKSSRRSRGCVHLCRCFDVLLNPSLIAFALLRAGLMHGPPCQLGPLAQGRKK